MSKYYFLNDHTTILPIHSASSTTRKSLKPQEGIWIKIPEECVPYIKVWDREVLLSGIAIKLAKDLK